MSSPAYPMGFSSSSAMQPPLYGAGVPVNNGQPQPVAQPTSTTPQFGQLPTNFHATAPYGTVPMGYPQQAMVRSGLRGNPKAAAAYAQLANEPLPAEGNPLLAAGASLALAGTVSLGTTEALYRMGLEKQLANTKTITTPAAELTDAEKLAVQQKFVADEEAKLLQAEQAKFEQGKLPEVKKIVPDATHLSDALDRQHKEVLNLEYQRQQVKNTQAYALLNPDSATPIPPHFNIDKEIHTLKQAIQPQQIPLQNTSMVVQVPPVTKPTVPLEIAEATQKQHQFLTEQVALKTEKITTLINSIAAREKIVLHNVVHRIEQQTLSGLNMVGTNHTQVAQQARTAFLARAATQGITIDLNTIGGQQAYVDYLLAESKTGKKVKNTNLKTEHLKKDSTLKQLWQERGKLKKEVQAHQIEIPELQKALDDITIKNQAYNTHKEKVEMLEKLQRIQAETLPEAPPPPKKRSWKNLLGGAEQPAVDPLAQAQQKLAQLEQLKQERRNIQAPTVDPTTIDNQAAIEKLIAAEQVQKQPVNTSVPDMLPERAEGWGKAWQHDTKALKTEGYEALAKHTDHAHAMGRWAGLAVALLGTGLTIQQVMQSKEAETATQTRSLQLAQLRRQQGLGS